MDLREVAFQKAIDIITARGAKFKVILPDGTEYGDLDVACEPRGKARKGGKYPRGALLDYGKKFVDDLKVDEVVSIPGGTFDVATLRGSLAAYCGTLWGQGSYTTHLNGSTIEIYRIK